MHACKLAGATHLHIHPAPVQLVMLWGSTTELAPQRMLTRSSWDTCGSAGVAEQDSVGAGE